MEHNGMERNGT